MRVLVWSMHMMKYTIKYCACCATCINYYSAKCEISVRGTERRGFYALVLQFNVANTTADEVTFYKHVVCREWKLKKVEQMVKEVNT